MVAIPDLMLSTGVVYGSGNFLRIQERMVQTANLARVSDVRCGMEIYTMNAGELRSIANSLTQQYSSERKLVAGLSGEVSLHAPHPPGPKYRDDLSSIQLFQDITRLTDHLNLAHIVFHSAWFTDFEMIAKLPWASLVVIEADDGRYRHGYRDFAELQKIVNFYGFGGMLLDVAHVSEHDLDSRNTINEAMKLPSLAAVHWSASHSDEYPHVPLSVSQGSHTREATRGATWRRGLKNIIETPLGAYNQNNGDRLKALICELDVVAEILQFD